MQSTPRSPALLRHARPATLDVLVPHYQDVAALARSLASVGQQNWRGALRTVVVDDGSDATVFEEVKRLVSRQSFPVTLRRSDENLGRPRARNLLLDEVEAPYLAWLDAGEVWYPDKLRLQFEHLRRLEFEGADLDLTWVTCHYDWLEDGRQRKVSQDTTGDQLCTLLIGDRLRAYLWTLVGRTTAFRAAGSFNEALPRLQDLDYFINFFKAGGTLSAPDTAPLCRYEKSDAGRKHADVAASAAHILQAHHALYEQYGSGFLALARWKYATLSARFAIRNRSYGAAARYMTRAAAANPRYTAYKLKQKLVG